jgi:serine phosphatase RsbU (regulator of sigma subunit)
MEEITFARAGHPPVLFCSGNGHDPQNILTKGIGLGLDAGKKFEENLEQHTISLKGSGTLVFYTDGVIEARNKEGMEFGEERLISLIKDCQDISAKEIKETLLNSVVDFCGETPLHDDLTFVILKNCQRLNKNKRKK